MRKKRGLWLLCLLVALACAATAGAVTAFAAESTAEKWETADPSVTVKGTVTVTATGTPDAEMKFTYNKHVDFSGDLGASFRFVIPKSSDTTLSDKARVDGSNYIDIKILNSKQQGVRLRYYGLYSKIASSVHKADVDVFYIDPAITAKKHDRIAGERYQETIELYENVEDCYHTVDLHKEAGYWFVAIDGLTSVPRKDMCDLDLSDCTVEFSMYSKTNAPTVKLYAFKSVSDYEGEDGPMGILKRYVTHDWMQFGSDIITYPGDDTVRFKIADKRAAQYPNTLIRYREQLISTRGYDVRQPINIEYSYDVSNASAVWYAVGLGRPDVLDSISLRKYNVYGTMTEKVKDEATGTETTVPSAADRAGSDYGDNIANANDGIMFQTGKGQAQPTYREQNNRTHGYTTHSPSKGYGGRSSVDLLTFIVHEDGTDMYFNGELIFDKLVTKQSDFADSGYMAYPYFHFFEDNASTAKGNTVVIKGVNAPRRTDETNLRVTGGSNKALEVGLDAGDDTNIKLYEYVGDDKVFTEIDASKYTYDAAAKKLTLQYSLFEGRAYDLHTFYARSREGSEELVVRLSDPALVTLPPVFEKSETYWKVKGGTEDLVLKVDIKNGNFVSFSGGGISKANWTFTPGEGTTVGTITIKKEFLNGKKEGPFTFKVKTDNIEGDTFEAETKIVVNKTGEAPSGGDDPGGDDDDNNNTNTENGGKRKSGCGSAAAASCSAAAVMLLMSAAIVLRRKANKIA